MRSAENMNDFVAARVSYLSTARSEVRLSYKKVFAGIGGGGMTTVVSILMAGYYIYHIRVW